MEKWDTVELLLKRGAKTGPKMLVAQQIFVADKVDLARLMFASGCISMDQNFNGTLFKSSISIEFTLKFQDSYQYTWPHERLPSNVSI